MNIVSRCKVYSLDKFMGPNQFTCEVNGQQCSRIHIVQETLWNNDKTKAIVERVRLNCSGASGLILNVSSVYWSWSTDPNPGSVFLQTNGSMCQFNTFIQFMNQLCSDPVTAISRCQADSTEATTAKPLAWILIDNLSHLSMDPHFNPILLSQSIKLVQRTFGSIIISTSLPLAFHGGVESTFKHQSTKCASGDKLLDHFNEADAVL